MIVFIHTCDQHITNACSKIILVHIDQLLLHICKLNFQFISSIFLF